MSNYLEFTTDPHNPHSSFALGEPLFEGEIPSANTRIRGLRVDGIPLSLDNSGFAKSVHHALIRGKELQNKGIDFECFALALLLQDQELSQYIDSGLTRFHEDISLIDVNPDISTESPQVVIGKSINMTGPVREDLTQWLHVMTPLATSESTPRYIHKLGAAGPVCLSGLSKAMKMYYDCNVARGISFRTI